VKQLKAREGDLIETFDGNIFDVKGLVHPPRRVIAFIRFTPDPKGDRKRRGVTYCKVYPLCERYELLQERFPQYLVYDRVFDEQLCEIPTKTINQHYKPAEYLRNLRGKKQPTQLETTALLLAEFLKKNAKIPLNAIGVSGSLLVGLHTTTSDIDLIVYGTQNCHKVYGTLKTLINDKNGQLKPYKMEELVSLFNFRSKDTVTSFEDFVRTETRKVLQGKFIENDYFIRFVKNWKETTEKYGTIRYSNEGYAKIEAQIVDDSEAIFTPCKYKIRNVKTVKGKTSDKTVKEIVSFRGRFCEQARKGETVVAQGKVERTQSEKGNFYFRLLLGNKTSDYMILA
jgi:predicted nucleotidyltransferase